MTDDQEKTGEQAPELLNKWEEIRTLIESMDLDVRKNAVRANASAGLRSRRGFRLLKKFAHELLMASVNADKRRSEARKVERDGE